MKKVKRENIEFMKQKLFLAIGYPYIVGIMFQPYFNFESPVKLSLKSRFQIKGDSKG